MGACFYSNREKSPNNMRLKTLELSFDSDITENSNINPKAKKIVIKVNL